VFAIFSLEGPNISFAGGELLIDGGLPLGKRMGNSKHQVDVLSAPESLFEGFGQHVKSLPEGWKSYR
jgi:hypothetical protein